MNFGKQLKEGLITQNPVLVQVLGMCSTMAITTSFFNGLGMGVSVLIILTLSNIFIALLRKIIPDEVRIACFIVVIAGFVTCVDLLLKAFVPALSNSLGVFIPLIVVNCIILGRAEGFASKNGVAVVDKEKCTNCGACRAACPHHLIVEVPYKQKVFVNCSNKDKGPAVTKVCANSCIACGMCERTCKFDAIHVIDNVAVIDYSKCKNCTMCAKACPRNAIEPIPTPEEKEKFKAAQKAAAEKKAAAAKAAAEAAQAAAPEAPKAE